MSRIALFLLLAVAPVAWASIEMDAAADYAQQPLDALLRLEFAQSLAVASGYEEEAQIGLSALLDDAAVGSAARASLIDLCTRNPARPGWASTYALLIEGPWSSESDPRRSRLELRLAQVQLETPTRRAEAIATLERLAEVWPRDPEPRLSLAHAQMLSGNPEAALDAVYGTGSAVTDARMRALASLAIYSSRPEDLRDLVPPRSDETDLLATALREPSPLNRAQVLQQAGYPLLAIDVLWRHNGAPSRSEEALPNETMVLDALGRLLLETSEYDAASTAFDKAIALDPQDDEARLGYARSLWGGGEHDQALAYLEDVSSEAAKAMYAEHLVRRAIRSSQATDDATAAARAYQLTPDNPFVGLHYGRSLVEQERYDEAIAPLTAAVSGRGDDLELVGLLVDAAASAGRPEQALPAVREALRLSDTPYNRRQLRQELSDALVELGEDRKSLGENDEALFNYALALLVEPGDPGVLMGLGGLWWHTGQLEHARSVFYAAYSQDTRNVDAVANLVSVSLAEGEVDAAREWLGKAPSGSHAQLDTLRRKVEVEATLQEARAARRDGDQVRAVAAYQALRSLYPDNATVSHELGDAFLEAGRPDEALETYRAALDVDPTNEWAILGEANALIALGQTEEASDRLRLLEDATSPELVRQVMATRARVHRANGDRHKEEGDDYGAFREYVSALNTAPDTWTLTDLGWLYLEHEQYATAIAFFTEALELGADNQVARRGRIFGLARAGNLAQARTEAATLAREYPSRENRELIDELRFQSEYQRAMAARARSAYDEARVILTALGAKRPDDPQVEAALAALAQDGGQSAHAMARAALVLDNDPTNELAVATLLAAAHDLDQPDKLEAILSKAVERGGGAAVQTGLQIASLQIKLAEARELHAARQTHAGIMRIQEAEQGAGTNPDFLALIGGAYLDLGAPRDAIRAYEVVLSSHPGHIPSVLGRTGAMRALGRSREADQFIEQQYELTQDPDVGLAYAEILRDQGRRKKAGLILDQILVVAERLPTEDRHTVDALPVIPLPSGRSAEAVEIDETGSEPQPIAIDPELESRVYGVRRTLKAPKSPVVSMVPAGFARPGFAGKQYLAAVIMPIALRDVAVGPLHLSAEMLPVSLNDGVRQETGGAITAGLSSSPRLPWGFRLHAGVSPAGFTGTPYATWYAQLRGQINDSFVGLESGRAPSTDSLMSWSGTTDPSSGTIIGRVSRTWFGTYMRVPLDANNDAGMSAHAGWIDILGGGSVPYGDASVWANLLITEGRPAMNLGIEGVVNSYGRQVDGFDAGQAGTFSPPLYAALYVRANGEAEDPAQDLWMAWSMGIGPQYLLGEDTVFFGAGSHIGADAMGSAAYRVTDKTRLGLDVRYQVTFGQWFQFSTMVRIDYSRHFDSARPLSNTGISPTFGDSVVNAQATRPR